MRYFPIGVLIALFAIIVVSSRSLKTANDVLHEAMNYAIGNINNMQYCNTTSCIDHNFQNILNHHLGGVALFMLISFLFAAIAILCIIIFMCCCCHCWFYC
jgi:hypothetical protein